MASRILLSIIMFFCISCTESNNTSEVAVTQGLSATTAIKSNQFRIMPLGDSITQSDSNHSSYRRPLWKRLEKAGFVVDFIGSQRRHYGGNAPYDDFDQDHEGHWGWRTDEILMKLDSWASALGPDAVLIHLGSNDIFQGQSIQSTVDELAEIVSLLRRANRQIIILLAQIIPTGNKRINQEIRKLNDAIALLGLRLDSTQSPVRVVDQYSGFVASKDTYDGVHPNERGEEKMAAKWQQILVKHIERRETGPGNAHLPMK